AACKVQLYSGLNQRDANEMLAVLLQAGIDADTVAGKEDMVLRVEQSQIDRAIGLLNARGLPRPKTSSLGDVFKQEGLISSPLEQRARFIYAMSEELSRTLSQLDGVISARVHIVIPERRPNEANPPPPSAAIFIKYQDDYDLNGYVPQIKQLVANAVEGLNYDKVSVVLFPSSSRAELAIKTKPADETDRKMMLYLAGGGGLVLLALVGVIVFLLLGRRRAKPAAGAA
ncbi:MAG TPA: type III secretion inner membrane ring lipoprotein SctJ, partial [Reyranella sp.]|nr:type III secretion inner membrane ring lipoprotein SctJ [Reyranella sp.]